MRFNLCVHFLLFFLFATCFASSSSFISDNAFLSQRNTGRALLQAQTSCPINFEEKNYTILTSQCKGPDYPAEQCCTALKEFCCPFVDKLNDMKTDCAATMFSNINLRGKFPPGLFSSKCREGKYGLTCQASPPPAPPQKSHAPATQSTLWMRTTALLALFLFMH
ncbi:GPI-anchored protein LLG1-like [Mangifera indica]|uniref:GPI-anchored protein LLG1-like n=1 Tax=Mangifera indica TaxID=29780 RepID=UPI001CFB2313|nr:GPI-anchored protein LLG1-like [Mangifera indica]